MASVVIQVVVDMTNAISLMPPGGSKLHAKVAKAAIANSTITVDIANVALFLNEHNYLF